MVALVTLLFSTAASESKLLAARAPLVHAGWFSDATSRVYERYCSPRTRRVAVRQLAVAS